MVDSQDQGLQRGSKANCLGFVCARPAWIVRDDLNLAFVGRHDSPVSLGCPTSAHLRHAHVNESTAREGARGTVPSGAAACQAARRANARRAMTPCATPTTLEIPQYSPTPAAICQSATNVNSAGITSSNCRCCAGTSGCGPAAMLTAVTAATSAARAMSGLEISRIQRNRPPTASRPRVRR